MSLLGPHGLRQVAAVCHHNLLELQGKLTSKTPIETVFQGIPFHETVIRLPMPAHQALQKLAEANIQGGLNLRPFYPELGECLLVCVTETKTQNHIEYYANLLRSQ
jgi:glycine dehydrogenase subunit 1